MMATALICKPVGAGLAHDHEFAPLAANQSSRNEPESGRTELHRIPAVIAGEHHHGEVAGSGLQAVALDFDDVGSDQIIVEVKLLPAANRA